MALLVGDPPACPPEAASLKAASATPAWLSALSISGHRRLGARGEGGGGGMPEFSAEVALEGCPRSLRGDKEERRVDGRRASIAAAVMREESLRACAEVQPPPSLPPYVSDPLW